MLDLAARLVIQWPEVEVLAARIVTACGEAVTAVMSAYKLLKTPYWA
jgi:hypothetical protein